MPPWQNLLLLSGGIDGVINFGFHRFSMVNAPRSNAYPIAGATWLLIYEKPRDPVRGKKLIEFLKWAETDGQKMAAELSFAPLPDNVRSRVLKVIGTLEP